MTNLPVDLEAFLREIGAYRKPNIPEPREAPATKPWRPREPGDVPPF